MKHFALILIIPLIINSSQITAVEKINDTNVSVDQDPQLPQPSLNLTVAVIGDYNYYQYRANNSWIFATELINEFNEILYNSSMGIYYELAELKIVTTIEEQDVIFNVTNIYDVSQYYTGLASYIKQNNALSSMDMVIGLSGFTFKELNINDPGAWYGVGGYDTAPYMMLGRGLQYPVWFAKSFGELNGILYEPPECPNDQYIMMDGSLLITVDPKPTAYSPCSVEVIKNEVLSAINDIHAPSILSPATTNFELGTEEILLVWELADQYPGYYEMYRDDILVDIDLWTNYTEIHQLMDNPEKGNYNYTIIGYDYFGNNISSTTIVFIIDTIAPQFSGVQDLIIDQQDSNSEISIIIADQDPSYFVIKINEELFTRQNFTKYYEFTMKLDFLPNGDYAFEIQAYDDSSNMNSANFDVSVNIDISENYVTTKTETVTEIVEKSAENQLPLLLSLELIPLLVFVVISKRLINYRYLVK